MAPAPSPQKVLVTGPVTTTLAAYFTKLATLQAKHNFDLVLAQDLFSSLPADSQDADIASLLRGDIKVPVQVYAAQGAKGLPLKVRERVDKGEEVTQNLSVLPKSGLLTLSSGLRLATLSGSAPLDPSLLSTLLTACTPSSPAGSSLPPPPPKTADILLSHLCPSSLSLASSKPLVPTEGRAVEEVFSPEADQAAKAARAKYHFVSSPGVFWEREPFVWPALSGAAAGAERSFCRAFSLGEALNKNKERWFYAFSITPSASPAPPASYTPSPFHPQSASSSSSSAPQSSSSTGPRGIKRPALDEEELNEMGVPNYIFGGQGGGKKGRNGENGGGGKGGPPPEHYTCHLCEQKGHWIQDCPDKEAKQAERDAGRMQRNEGAARASAKPISPDECWFCLSNPQVTKHLIASIGEEVYVTLPKGQVVSTDASPVPGGGHVMVIPISHYPTLRSIPSDLAPPVLQEIESYKQALKRCYAKFGAEMVAFEVARTSGRGGHAHIQICPIPSSLSPLALSTFTSSFTARSLPFDTLPAGSDELVNFHTDHSEEHPEGADYFKVDLPDGSSLVHWMKRGQPFSLQFGRETLATLLQAPERADWKACSKSAAEEKSDTSAFKKAFAEFDPST